jgi:hypothetical protein
VRSLAGEYLRELEKFDGSERQQQEEAVMLSMGSLYQGKLSMFLNQVHGTYETSFSWYRHRAYISIFPQVSYRLLQRRLYLQ